MEGSSEVEIPAADDGEGKTAWMKFAIYAGIAFGVLWVLAGVFLVLSIFSGFIPVIGGLFSLLCSPATGCFCCLGWLSLIAAIIFVILGVMKV